MSPLACLTIVGREGRSLCRTPRPNYERWGESPFVLTFVFQVRRFEASRRSGGNGLGPGLVAFILAVTRPRPATFLPPSVRARLTIDELVLAASRPTCLSSIGETPVTSPPPMLPTPWMTAPWMSSSHPQELQLVFREGAAFATVPTSPSFSPVFAPPARKIVKFGSLSLRRWNERHSLSPHDGGA